jgi:hypothetical protein
MCIKSTAGLFAMTSNLSLHELLRTVKSNDPLVNALIGRVEELVENVELLLETTPVTDDNDTWVEEIQRMLNGREHERDRRRNLERDFLFSREMKNRS